MLYAVQYRNARTANYYFAIFDDRDSAVTAAAAWEKNEVPPPGFEEHFLGILPIHWAYPPKCHPVTGKPIKVVNRPFDVC